MQAKYLRFRSSGFQFRFVCLRHSRGRLPLRRPTLVTWDSPELELSARYVGTESKSGTDGHMHHIVVSDEAHLLDRAQLEELRLLTNAEMDSASPVRGPPREAALEALDAPALQRSPVVLIPERRRTHRMSLLSVDALGRLRF